MNKKLTTEKFIKKARKNNINYVSQKKFNNCKGNKYKLPFDFYLLKLNLCIKFDGRKHFESINYFG